MSDNVLLSVHMLGKFELAVEDVVVSDINLHSHKLWSLLAYLISNRNRSVSQSELIENFWGDAEGTNPLSSLKTSFTRLRKLLQPISDITGELILSSRGAYQWNKSIPCWYDVEQFECYCRIGMNPSLSLEERILNLMAAQKLYLGDYLPKQKDELWAMPEAAHLKITYLEIVKNLWSLLDAEGNVDEMVNCATHALTIDPLEEVFHCELIRTLIRQGNEKEALAHCRYTQDLLYKNLRVQPSAELSALFEELFKQQHTLGCSQEGIIKNLTNSGQRNGAFYCEYGIFEEIFRLETRRTIRSGSVSHLCILTLMQDNQIPELGILNIVMPQLLRSISESLRSGDVVSKCSGAQLLNVK